LPGYNADMGTRALLTAEDFLKLAPQEGKRFELDEGELIELTFPSFRHNEIVGNIYSALRSFLEEHPCGMVFPSDSGFKLSAGTVRGPDVSFLRAERGGKLDLDSNFFPGAPDLAVEVASASDTATGLQRKVVQYLRAGADTVWIVYPDTQELHVFRQDGSALRLTAEDDVTSELLPGFSAKVYNFFRVPRT